MSAVFENTGKRVRIYSDNGMYRLIATRRAIMEECNGVTHFYGSKWYIETHQRQGYDFVPIRFAGLQYIVNRKKDLIDMLSKSVQFTQAYAELKSK